jgi:diadenosine tetraphosphate (Ap4A) HIT family hydrolase
VPPESSPLPEFVSWPEFPFEGEFRVRALDGVAEERPREGDDPEECPSCGAPDDAYLWVSDRWRVKAAPKPSGLPAVVILESRSHLDLGDLPNLLAAELGVMTVRLERAIRSLPGVARVHVNRWGDGLAHLHVWFFARPTGQLQLRGSFLTLWKDVLPPIPDDHWRDNLGLIAAWLADFGGRAVVDPPRFEWQSLEALSQHDGGAEAQDDEAEATQEG